MKIADNVTKLIGNTPLVKINKLNAENNATIVAKLESFNPAHSIKDRVAVNMIETAEKEGLLEVGKSVIIEPTSGNTGIGLALACAVKGYKLILTMPETMSIERQLMVKAYGAEVVLTEGGKGMQGAIDKANELALKYPKSFIPQQFANPANPETHKKSTALEIWNDTDGEIDILVAGVGTGGTISGIGQFLKDKNPNIKIVAVEPASSAVLSGKPAGMHKIQGIGAGFIPDICDTNIIDEIVPVSNDDAINTARELGVKEGILAGISGGAAIFAALEIANRAENNGKLIVTILPDFGERYLSTELYANLK
ncbi:cysteine synthase A [bacterium]|nr:cysteine synthase A [bacterium]